MKILLVEDDDAFIKVLTRTLKAHHYIVDIVKDGEMGWTYGSTFEYDLIMIDIVLPKLDGMSLCKRFRAEAYPIPILLLTDQDSSSARVQGLDAGADDYVVKPFDQAELVARIRALVRRGSANPFPLLTWGDLILNPSTCEVSYQGQNLALTTKEYELLELMMRDSHHVFSTDELLDHLWSSEKFPSEATVRSHIRRVRNKLVAIGASQDFIATLHGRGYYLKVPQTDTLTAQASTAQTSIPQILRSPQNPSVFDTNGDLLNRDISALSNTEQFPDAQAQYLEFLNEIWITTKSNSLDQLAVLCQAIQNLQVDQLTPQHRTQSQQLAHKLAGTLGIFGLQKALDLVRQLEYWLGSQDPLHPHQAPFIHDLVKALQQVIQETMQIQSSPIPSGNSPLLLLISADDALNQSLQAIALNRGIQIEMMSPLEMDTLGMEGTTDAMGRLPDVILLRLFPNQLESSRADQSALVIRSRLQVCAQLYPDLPIVVMCDRLELGDRLELVRQGGKLLLDISIPPEQVMTSAINLLKRSKLPTKVMIVDDDHHWLRTLPTLLKPWDFKVTTLAESQQFWIVLQAVSPDVLVLDVNMPEINGFELCQILRSDPNWQRLPVIFLSVLTDSTSQQQAFSVGADDYLVKPLMGGELANRILSRLQRLRAYTG